MKRSIPFLLLLVSLTQLNAQAVDEEHSLTLDFTVTKHNKGDILVALYNSEGTHMKDALKDGSVRVEDNKAQFVVRGLPSGYYSFSYYHDVNSNNELDSNMLGIPKEPYGFSNNQKGKFGPPSYEESKIRIEKDMVIEVEIE